MALRAFIAPQCRRDRLLADTGHWQSNLSVGSYQPPSWAGMVLSSDGAGELITCVEDAGGEEPERARPDGEPIHSGSLARTPYSLTRMEHMLVSRKP
ncbi:hypothetical protein GmRootV116_62680 (plasmid) [Variovorax sp. V116]|jgi:hypothetical protein